MKTEKYRFQHGSLYEWNETQKTYIHVFKKVGVNTKARAIKEYESWH